MKHILDTSAFLSGIDLKKSDKAYTTPSVLNELKSANARLKADTDISQGILKVKTPDEAFRLEIKNISSETGDIDSLSSTDIDVLALALKFSKKDEVIIISDDYSLQNVAAELNMEYKGTYEKRITKKIRWAKQCIGCKKEFPADFSGTCTKCGNSVKKKPKKN